MRLTKKISIFSVIALALAVIATPTFVGAERNDRISEKTSEHQTTETNDDSQTKEPEQEQETKTENENEVERNEVKTRDTAQTRREGLKETIKTRLEGEKLKSCQNREKTITTIMSRIADRGQKQFDLFTTIADKTETFYKEKGNTVATYDTLTADLAAKKATAQATIDTVNANKATFKCDETNPRGIVSSFKESLKAEISALKEYRTAVKNLIVGVKSAQGTTASTDTTEGSN